MNMIKKLNKSVMMKNFVILILAVLMPVMLFAGCDNSVIANGDSVVTDRGTAASDNNEGTVVNGDSTTASDDEIEAVNDNEYSEVTSGDWNVSGTYTYRDSDQYNNAVLRIKILEESIALFEIDITESSDTGDRSVTLQIAGTMYIDESGTGIYECYNEEENVYTVLFGNSNDGHTITVSHTGDIPLNPDGIYDFIGTPFEADAGLSIALLENLPTAATSLNSNIGPYTINYPDESVLNYFYPVTVTLDDTGAVLGLFLVTADLSAVWRLDTEDGIPFLIYGSAQDMLDIIVYRGPGESDDPEAEISLETSPLLPVIMESGVFLNTGDTTGLVFDSPYPFGITFDGLLSTDGSIASVDAEGTVIAVSPGIATITGSIILEDGRRDFTVALTVGAENEPTALITESENEEAVG